MQLGPMPASYFFLVGLLVISSSSNEAAASIPPSQIRSLIRIPKILEYPPSVAPLRWSSNNSVINFCGIPPKPDLNLTCDTSGRTVVGLHIGGTRNSSQKLSPAFSSESLGNLLSSLPDLQTLGLVHLGLWGNIPGKLDHLLQLKSLNMSSNAIDGSLPQRLSTLHQVEVLDLSGNEIDGSFPTWLGDLANLTSVDLSGNRMSGNIPSDVALPATLQSIDVSSNLFTGQPPKSFLVNSTMRVRFEKNCMVTTLQTQYGQGYCVARTGAKASNSSTIGAPKQNHAHSQDMPLIVLIIAGLLAAVGFA